MGICFAFALVLVLLFFRASQADAWYNASWTYRIKVTSNAAQVSADETDIPLYIDLSTFPASFFTTVSTTGGVELVVTAADETTVLEHELVRLSTSTQTGELHVKIPSLLSTTGTEIYVYYGNATGTDSSTVNTWSDYRAVWHMDDATSSSSPRIGVVTQQAMDGADGGWGLLYGLAPLATNISTVIDEDQQGDTERAHTTEQVSYWVFESDAAFDIQNSVGAVIGEGGVMTDLGTTPTAQTLRNTYTNPVVVTAPVLLGPNAPPFVIRMSATTTNSFTVYQQYPGNLTTPSSSDMYYLVFEGGAHTLPGGVLMEAGTVLSTATNENGNWNSSQMDRITTVNAYTTPIVLGQVMTTNDADWSVFWTSDGNRQRPPDSADVYVGKHVAADPDNTRANETLGYVIVEAGTGTTNGINWDAALSADTARGPDNAPPYAYALSNNTLSGTQADATINSFDGTVNGTVQGNINGRVGKAVYTDGNNGTYITTGGMNYTTANSLSALTASMWIRTHDSVRSGILDFDISDHWGVGLNFHNNAGDTGRVSFNTYAATGGNQRLNSSAFVNDANWHYVTVVYDHADITDKKIYIDGVLDTSIDQHSTPIGRNRTRHGIIGDGSEATTEGSSTNNRPYEGLLDELRIKHSADTATRVLTSYNNVANNALFWTLSTPEMYNVAPSAPTVLYAATSSAQTGTSNPTDLTVGGTSTHQIVFSALYQDDDTGDIADAARIQVSTDATFATITHWDSGYAAITSTTEGNRSLDITFDSFGTAASNTLSMDDGAVNYYWRISFRDDSAAEGTFSSAGVFTLLDLPSAPTGVSVLKVNGTPDTFTVSWSDVSTNESYFDVERNEDAGSGFGGFEAVSSSPVDANVTSTSDINTTDNRGYMYRVRACNYVGCSSYVADPLSHFTDPAAPDSVYGIFVTNTEFTLNYTDRAVLGFVDLEHCVSSSTCNTPTFTVIGDNVTSSINVAATSSDATGITADEIIRWRVRATNAASTTVSAYTASAYEYTVPTAPTMVSATYMTDTIIGLTWADNSTYEDGFRIWVSENGGTYFEMSTGTNSVGANVTNTLYSAANANSSYTFRVVAHIGATTYNAALTSTSTDSAMVKSTPNAPTGVTSTYNADNNIALSWADNASFEDNYRIYVSINSGTTTYVTTIASSTTNYTYTAGTSDNTYAFAVEALVVTSSPQNPTALSASSSLTSPVIYTTPAAPTLATSGYSNSSIDWAVTDNSTIETGFIFFNATNSLSVQRFAVPNISSWTETGLSPNVQYSRTVSVYVTNGGVELQSPSSSAITLYTLANAPVSTTASEDGTNTTVSWLSNNNPSSTEFQATNITTGAVSGWSTSSFGWVLTAPTCNAVHEIQVASRNGDLIESLSDSVMVTGTLTCTTGSSSSSTVSSESSDQGVPFVINLTQDVPLLFGAEESEVTEEQQSIAETTSDAVPAIPTSLTSNTTIQTAVDPWLVPEVAPYCYEYIIESFNVGEENIDQSFVTRVQEFLNTYEGTSLANTGVYDEATIAEVIAFQERYASDVLGPWGLAGGTGYVYTTTINKMNSIICANNPGDGCIHNQSVYLLPGDPNANPDLVRRVKAFLNRYEGENLDAVSGLYDSAMLDAVVRFQEKYADDVLDPWEIDQATGYVYMTTINKMNEIYCTDSRSGRVVGI